MSDNSMEHIRAFSEAISDFFWQTDAQNLLTYLSPQFSKLLKTSPEKYIRKHWQSVFVSTELEKINTETSPSLSFRNIPVSIENTEGNPLRFSLSGTPHYDSEGTFIGYWGTGNLSDPHLVAQKEKAEKDLRLFKARFKDFADIAADWIWEMGPDFKYTYFSRRRQEILGVPLEQSLGKTPDDLALDGINQKGMKELLDDLKNHRPFRDFQYKNNELNGLIRYLRSSGKPFFDDEGKFLGYRGTGSDITDQVAAELTVKENQEWFRTIAESASDWFWETDKDLRFSFISDRFFEVAKIKRKDILGKTRQEIIEERNWTHTPNFWARHFDDLNNRRAFKIAYPIKRDDGKTVHITINGKPYFDSDGAFKGYRGAGTDITSQVEFQEALKAAKEEAEEANMAKSEFLSRMSHELRTPLNSILGFSQLLKSGAASELNTEQERFIDHVLKAGNHLLDLINEVLDLAKVEAGKLDLSIENVSPDQVIGSCIDLMKPLADNREITICYEEKNRGEKEVRADFTRLKQVLVNLLSNAVKYNRSKGNVIVDWKMVDDKSIRFSVEDTGFGISKENLEYLFIPFSRFSAEQSDIQGTGIGLTITQKLVQLMGGTLNVESTVGKGSRFWVDLPLSDKTTHSKVSQNTDQKAGGVMSILYVEDNPVNIELMENILKTWSDIEIISTHTGELGLEIAKAKRPDLVILDINLPGINGITLLKQFKASPTIKAIPIIALSAVAGQKDVERGLEAGFQAYLAKPINVMQTTEAIKNALGLM